LADAFESQSGYAGLFEELVSTGRFEVFVYDDDIPYLVSIVDETVHIGAHEGEEPRAIVETDSSEVNEWAEGMYHEYKQEAEQLVP
jgi:predicted transcriptional regulator